MIERILEWILTTLYGEKTYEIRDIVELVDIPDAQMNPKLVEVKTRVVGNERVYVGRRK